VKTLAIGNLDSETGIREVFFEVNGFMRTIYVEDKKETAVSISIRLYSIMLYLPETSDYAICFSNTSLC